MTGGFWYRRRGEPDESRVYAASGVSIQLNENTPYVLEFQSLSDADAVRVVEIGGEFVGPRLALLSFTNFVGLTRLAGVLVRVHSTKLGDGGASALLSEVSRLSRALVFGSRSPTAFAGTEDLVTHSPIPYHQLQAIRESMLHQAPGRRLQDYLAHIARHPTRRFERRRTLLHTNQVKRLDRTALMKVFSHVDRLSIVPATNNVLSTHPLAQALTFGTPARPHFPSHVAAAEAELSFDTPENRFVKHAVADFLSIVRRFSNDQRLHESMRRDATSMLSILEEAASAPHLASAAQIASLSAPSQALVKAEGYRQLYAFWSEITHHRALPPDPQLANRMLEGRDIATLYEYWVFSKIVEAVVRVTGAAPLGTPAITTSVYDGSLTYGCSVDFCGQTKVAFNKTYTRSSGTAYSTPLRPDVVVSVGESECVFDAKYRMDKLDLDPVDSDDAPATASYKRADLYKMHAYRDALRSVRAAFVVYPGSEFVFFERSGRASTRVEDLEILDGVGAVPLRPGSQSASDPLVALLCRVLGTSP